MADIEKHLVGIQSLFFIGSMSATGTVLTKVKSRRTEGLSITDEVKSEWLVGLNRRAATSERTIIITPKFYNDSVAVYNFANNCPIAATGFNTGSDYSELYMVCIIDTVPLSDKCYILYNVNTTSGRKINYNKDNPTACPIVIEGNQRNPETDLLFRGTSTEVQAKLGVRNPLI